MWYIRLLSIGVFRNTHESLARKKRPTLAILIGFSIIIASIIKIIIKSINKNHHDSLDSPSLHAYKYHFIKSNTSVRSRAKYLRRHLNALLLAGLMNGGWRLMVMMY